MVTVDTNIIIRLLTRDEPTQYSQAYKLFQTHVIYIPKTIILECEWVLRHAYGFTPQQVISALNYLFGLPNIYLENETEVSQALQWHNAGIDFTDALHLSQSQTSTTFFTFDRKLISHSENLGNCPVREP